MSTLSNKLQYAIKWIDDIQKALEEHGFNMNNLPLEKYGDKIREIKSTERPMISNMSKMATYDKPVIQSSNTMFIISPNLHIIGSHVWNAQIQEKEIIKKTGNLFIINNGDIINDMPLAIEEV
jgi:hypothetical protein